MRRSLFTELVPFVLVALAAAIASADDTKEEALKKDRERIAGTWRIVALVVNGNEVAEQDARKLKVVNGPGDSWTLYSEEKEIAKGINVLDPTKTPKTIDFELTEGEGKGMRHLGIYDLGEKTRRLCFAPPGKDRPTEFASKAGTEHILATFEREKETQTAVPGLKIVTAGHSFHMFLPGILRELAKAGGIEGQEQVAAQGIGGSRVIQHWDRPDDKNQVKPALATGKVDVLTLSPIYLPDQGIENFVELALKHNPKVRVTLQSFWLPYDVYFPNYQKEKPPTIDRNARTAEELRKESAPYFASYSEFVAALNKKYEKEVVFIVPTGQAAIALREKIIAGEAPGLKQQNDLFTDPIGHATPPLMALNAYCHYAVLYRKSPVGLPVPGVLRPKQGDPSEELVKLNRLLQELAWEACLAHPHSGVKK